MCVTVGYNHTFVIIIVTIPIGFLPFGPAYGDSRVPSRLDGSTGEIQLGTDVIIFGARQNQLYVSHFTD